MSAGKPEIPTFSEPVVGYRNWRVDAWQQLWSTSGHGCGWLPGENVASCVHDKMWTVEDAEARQRDYPYWNDPKVRMAPHSSPHKDCECGLYARFRPPTRTDAYPGSQFNPDGFNPVITGAIAAWGDLEVHPDGFRAQRACVIALALEGVPKTDSLVQILADTYEVPAVPRALLETEALLYGAHLPESVIPEKPKPKPLDSDNVRSVITTSSGLTVTTQGGSVHKVVFDESYTAGGSKLRRLFGL